jgi:hypothetical protein
MALTLANDDHAVLLAVNETVAAAGLPRGARSAWTAGKGHSLNYRASSA